MARRTPGLERPDTIIKKTIHHMGKTAEKKYYMHWVLWHWSDIVGEFIARNTEVQGIRKEVLYLYSDNAALRNELQMMMPQIVQQVNNYAGQKMISKVVFGKRWEKADTEGLEEIRLARQEKEENWGAKRRKMPLSPREMQQAEALAAQASDEEIGTAAGSVYRKYLQMQKLRQAHNWNKCPGCGRLKEPEKGLCPECSRRQRENVNAAIRQVLRDMPWARYREVREFVPDCTPKLINEQRAAMVQRLAAEVEAGDTRSIKAKTLVMLYRCLPPEQLTEDNITRTIYALRFDLHRPRDYKAPRRYDVIKLGKGRTKS